MTIIPASKTTAAYFVSAELKELLSWASIPVDDGLPDAWADTFRAKLRGATKSALNSFADDQQVCKALQRSQRLAFEFIGLLANNPTLAVMPVHEWPVAAYRQLFDDLSVKQREFRMLSDIPDRPKREAVRPETTEKVPVKTPPPPKRPKDKKRWTVPDIEQRIRLELESGDPENVQKYLFASLDDLKALIGCGRTTPLNTKFWKEDRDELQKHWRRQNNGKHTRKREA